MEFLTVEELIEKLQTFDPWLHVRGAVDPRVINPSFSSRVRPFVELDPDYARRGLGDRGDER